MRVRDPGGSLRVLPSWGPGEVNSEVSVSSRHWAQRRAISSAPSRRCGPLHSPASGGASRTTPARSPPGSGSCGAGTPGARTASSTGHPGRAATTVSSRGDRSYSMPQSQAAIATATSGTSSTTTVQRAPAPSWPRTSP